MVSRASVFILLFRMLNVQDIDVFASEDGEAMVTAYLPDFYLESNLEIDGSVTVVEEIRDETSAGETYACDRDAFVGIGQRINSVRLAREQERCGWYESSLSKTLTTDVGNLTTTHLRIPQMGQVSRYFAPLAHTGLAARSAGTWTNIIQGKQVTRQYFGNSTPPFSKGPLKPNKAIQRQGTNAILA
jgi:hypothetical protein